MRVSERSRTRVHTLQCTPFSAALPPQIKSTTLDAWQSDWVNLIARVGNVRFNAVFEARLTDRCVWSAA